LRLIFALLRGKIEIRGKLEKSREFSENGGWEIKKFQKVTESFGG